MVSANLLYEIIKIFVVSSIIYVVYFYYKYFTRENPLPGPFPLPLIGNTHQIYKNFSLDIEQLENYGNLCEFYVGNRRFILLGDDNLVQEVMRPIVNSPFHNRVNNVHEGLKEYGFLNTGLTFNGNYDEWKFHRKFFNKLMLSPPFIRQSVTAIQNSFVEMEKYWENFEEDTTLEFSSWIKRYFFETIFFTTTSKHAYALANYYSNIAPNKKSIISESILKESNMLILSTDTLFRGVNYFSMFPKFIRNLPVINRYTQYLKNMDNWLRNNVRNIIKSRREEISKKQIDQELKSDMLTTFLTVNTERDFTEGIANDFSDKPMTDENIITNFIEVLTGGTHTSSNTLCILINFLENNPKVKLRMIEEIERIFGKDPNSLLTFEKLSKLEYLEAIIKESSRLCTIIPFDLRNSGLDVTVGNYKWPKDTNFILYYDRIHRNRSYWKDPYTFNPDRFVGKDNMNHKKLYMFGGGERMCPGRNLAIMKLKATILMLYRKYDLELTEPMNIYFTGIRNCEIKVKVKRKKDL